MIAASPNWRSRSRSSVRRPPPLASAAARFVAMAVLPVPPFGEKTVMIRPSRFPPAAARRGACVALRIAKTTFSVSAGGDEQQRDAGGLADRRDLVHRQGGRARPVQHAVEMTALERAGGGSGMVA